MARQKTFQILVGLFFIFFLAGEVHAHGGHKKPAATMEEPSPTGDSPYAIDATESSTGEEGGFPLSRSDIFADEPSLTPEAMDHKMPHVEIAEREWVSPKQKGYGAAVGITLIAGLIFGVLNFKRPLE